MSAVLAIDEVPAAPVGLRTIKIGILGLGQVGQAVARLALEATRLNEAGLRCRVVGALVRDIDKPRRCVKPSRVTTNPSAFLRGNYDVVIEALGTVEPARTIVGRLLGRGVPVVTANKALVAAHGLELSRLAARRGTTLRFEASALAGVPFLGAFTARPLVSDVREFTAVVNGTSNYILSKIAERQCSFEHALHEAQALGLTEPDADRDLDGRDAADKLTLLASIFGWGTLPTHRVETNSIRGITPADFAIASALDSTIKPVVLASRGEAGIRAFVGPALVPRRHPLAALHGSLSGIQLKGSWVSDLFFSGPGAGPDITAATLLDDAVEAVSSQPTRSWTSSPVPRAATLLDSQTEWLVRLTFPGFVPDAAAVAEILRAHHLSPVHVTDARERERWARLAPITSEGLRLALSRIAATHRIQTFSVRSL